jgi:peptidyl-dipeptidase Dcp
VLDRYHAMYKRAVRRSTPPRKARLGDINERLATLGTTFSQNVLADEQGYTLVLDGEDDLAGFPISCARRRRPRPRSAALPGKHVVTISRSSVEPFLQFSPPRSAREDFPRLDRARRWRRRNRQQGDHRRDGGAARRARAAARLSDVRPLPARRAMAKTPEGVLAVRLSSAYGCRREPRQGRCRGRSRVWCRRKAKKFRARPMGLAPTIGEAAQVRCDHRRKAIKRTSRSIAYRAGAFYTANRLFGLTFERVVTTFRSGHDDAAGVEVRRCAGSSRAFLRRLFRASARQARGAWNDTLRDQERLRGDIRRWSSMS